MSKQHVYHQGDDAYAVSSMKKYFDKKQEMDKLLDVLIAPYIVNNNLQILDAGCGIGHSIYFLNELSPGSQFLGVDQTEVYIKEATKFFGSLENAKFVTANVEELPAKYSKFFDVAVSRAVISWMPGYEKFMQALVAVTKKHIFVSSLFYDGDVDFFSTIKMYKGESGVNTETATELRNVYSFPRFKKFVESLGAKEVVAVDFEMPIDLPKPSVDMVATFTEKLANGKRLQISGAIIMSWKWVRIDL